MHAPHPGSRQLLASCAGVLLSQVMHQQNKLGNSDKSTAPLEQPEAEFGFFTRGSLEGDTVIATVVTTWQRGRTKDGDHA